MKKLSNINESSLNRVYQHYQKHDSGTITGYRQEDKDGKPLSKKDNAKRNTILRAKLLKEGYGITKLKGNYIENFGSDKAKVAKEESYFVVDLKDSGKLRDSLIKLGTEFEQDSIAFSKANGEYVLIATSKDESVFPEGPIGTEFKIGKPKLGKDGEMYSMVNGRPFVFENNGYLSEWSKMPASQAFSISKTAEYLIYESEE